MIHPYRQIPERDLAVTKQMALACEVLHEWRNFKPVVSGGALWAWAANNPARDVDVFVKSTRRSRKKAKEYIHDPSACQLKRKKVVSGSYYHHETAVGVRGVAAYRSVLPDGTPIDIVLCPSSGMKALEFFDYQHCRVAFGLDAVNLHGVVFYVDGELSNRHKLSRDKDTIRKKLQLSLWGSPNAETAMVRLVSDLRTMYSTMYRK